MCKQATTTLDDARRSVEHATFCSLPDGLSGSARFSAGNEVRPEEPDDESQNGEGKIAVDVLSMVEEVSVNHFVDDNDHHDDQQPDEPVGNEVLPHAQQDPFRQSFRQALRGSHTRRQALVHTMGLLQQPGAGNGLRLACVSLSGFPYRRGGVFVVG